MGRLLSWWQRTTRVAVGSRRGIRVALRSTTRSDSDRFLVANLETASILRYSSNSASSPTTNCECRWRVNESRERLKTAPTHATVDCCCYVARSPIVGWREDVIPIRHFQPSGSTSPQHRTIVSSTMFSPEVGTYQESDTNDLLMMPLQSAIKFTLKVASKTARR